MGEQDRLAEVEACKSWHDCDCRPILRAEVERLRVGAAGQKRLIEDGDRWMERANRLRGLLARLEWVDFGGIDGCPVCHRRSTNPHTDDCWLAKEVHPGTPNAPQPEG
jgi:hypothetical protein